MNNGAIIKLTLLQGYKLEGQTSEGELQIVTIQEDAQSGLFYKYYSYWLCFLFIVR